MKVSDKDKEINALKSLFTISKKDGTDKESPTCKRTKNLIAKLSFSNSHGVLYNSHWAYSVPFAFCNQLDIEFSKLKKMIPDLDEQGNQKKTITGKGATKPYYYAAWTQGLLLNFSYGHYFRSLTNNSDDIQICASVPVSVNKEARTINEGQVSYRFFKKQAYGESYTVTQFEFLKILIHGIEAEK